MNILHGSMFAQKCDKHELDLNRNLVIMENVHATCWFFIYIQIATVLASAYLGDNTWFLFGFFIRWFSINNKWIFCLRNDQFTDLQSNVKNIIIRIINILQSIFQFLSALYLFIYSLDVAVVSVSTRGESNPLFNPFIVKGIVIMLVSNLPYFFYQGIVTTL